MSTRANFLTIPDTAGDIGSESSHGETYDERHSGFGTTPGPPLRRQLSDSAPLTQYGLNCSPDHASTARDSIKNNPEIVTRILGHLGNQDDRLAALRVCRDWSARAAEVLWFRPDLSHYSTVEKLVRTLESPDTTFPYCKLIRRLNVVSSAPWIEDSTLTTFSRCDLLERLNLHGSRALTPPALEATLKSWPNLISIDLTDVTQVTDEAIIALAGGSPNLRGINLNGCRAPGDLALIALTNNCHNLCRVRMGASSSITDVGISTIVKGCPHLLELDLRNCRNITDIAVREVWTHSARTMRELHLGFCTGITDLAFPAKVGTGEAGDVPRDQKELNVVLPGQGEHDAAKGQEVSGSPLGPPVEVDTAQLVPKIRELAITDPQEHVSLLPGLSKVEIWRTTVPQTLAGLRILDLASCFQITDIAVEQIVSSAPRLRNFVLSKCSLLTNRSIEAICELGSSLNFLHIAHVDQVTDEAIKKLVQSCTRIRYLDFAGCHRLTDDSIVELSKLPKLRRVGLVRVSKITDASIYALGARTKLLERAHLSYCTGITLKAIHFFLDKASKLTHLSLTGVPAFMEPELQRFCREPPKDFNSGQRAAFCVYSGQGLKRLRAHLDATLGEPFDEQNLAHTIGDAPPTGDVGSDSESDDEAQDAL